MNLSDLGELKLIERLASHNEDILTPRFVAIGDDAAVVPKDEFTDSVYTTDLLIEDIHFIKDKISAYDLGFKSLAVNLSDIAAMGAQPRYCFLSLALPNDLSVDWVDDFSAGFFELAKKHSATLLGGDTTRSQQGICINVLVVGEIERGQSRLRSLAKNGDCIAVTGFLGDSTAGLKLLLENSSVKADGSDHLHLIRTHHAPLPHIQEGQWLSQQKSVHAMMDISDGLNSDIKRIMERSKCGANIDLDHLPLSRELLNVCKTQNWEPVDLAATGGEDYCLLLTFDPEDRTRLQEAFKRKFNRCLFVVGEVTDNTGILKYQRSGRECSWQPSPGFSHFK